MALQSKVFLLQRKFIVFHVFDKGSFSWRTIQQYPDVDSNVPVDLFSIMSRILKCDQRAVVLLVSEYFAIYPIETLFHKSFTRDFVCIQV